MEKELDEVDTDGPGNLEDLRRPVFIDEKCHVGSLKLSIADGGGLTRNINQRRKSDVFTSLMMSTL